VHALTQIQRAQVAYSPQSALGLEDTFVASNASVHDEVVRVPSYNFSEENRYLEIKFVKQLETGVDGQHWSGFMKQVDLDVQLA
jgi:hypothetical protein